MKRAANSIALLHRHRAERQQATAALVENCLRGMEPSELLRGEPEILFRFERALKILVKTYRNLPRTSRTKFWEVRSAQILTHHLTHSHTFSHTFSRTFSHLIAGALEVARSSVCNEHVLGHCLCVREKCRCGDREPHRRQVTSSSLASTHTHTQTQHTYTHTPT